MSLDLSLSQCGQFLTIELNDDWDEKVLKLMTFQARSMQQTHGISRILIKAKTWLNKNVNMNSIFSIGESLSRLVESNWKIAVVTPDTNDQYSILENVLSLKGIELLHFNQEEKAEVWLLQK